MSKFLEIKKDEKEEILVRNFEEVLKVADIVYFNENHIEIPGVVIFSKENKGIVFQLMNPGVDILQVEEEDFNNMTTLLGVEDEGVIYFDTKTVPASRVRINLQKIVDNLIMVKKTKDTIFLNNILFTTNEMEFQGSGMFSGRKNVFWVSEDIFSKLAGAVKE